MATMDSHRCTKLLIIKEMDMATGVVKWFNDSKGFGFIDLRRASWKIYLEAMSA